MELMQPQRSFIKDGRSLICAWAAVPFKQNSVTSSTDVRRKRMGL
jgi:hypothetical protein